MKCLKHTPYEEEAADVAQHYAVGISDTMFAAMGSPDPQNDPIARQFIPTRAELDTRDDEYADPIGDKTHSPVPAIVHRYPSRVLLKMTSICPLYCRYCFRKTMVGAKGDAIRKSDIADAVDYIQNQPKVREVILTGGDPLMVSPQRAGGVFSALDGIAHVKTMRIHTRTPIARPDLVGSDMLSALDIGKPLYMVLHVNHAQELTDEARRAISDLRRSGVILLSQSVLLRGVNDDAGVLQNLFEGLMEVGVKPYMLHQLDRAPGTAHFHVPVSEGQELMRALRGRISGIAMPEYILDIPQGAGKVPLTPSYVEENQQGGYRVRDYRGKLHDYE